MEGSPDYERMESELRMLRRDYEELKAYKEELEELLSRAKSHPLDFGFVVDKLEDGVIVNLNGNLKSFQYGTLSDEEVRNLKEGQYVFIGPVPDSNNPSGYTMAVTRVFDKFVDLLHGEVISQEGDTTKISVGGKTICKQLSSMKLRAGDEVGLMPGTMSIKKKYGSRQRAFEVIERPNVTFGDVGGLDNVKENLDKNIIFPLKNPKLYQKYGIKSRRILMYGPHGCGKTMLAKALANELTDCGFLKTGGSADIYIKWLGESARNVDAIFKFADQKLRDGECKHLILFFDELDAIAPPRGMYFGSAGADVRVVGQLLHRLEGFEDLHPGLIIIGASNRIHGIDPQLRSRFDVKMEVPQPDKVAGTDIVSKYIKPGEVPIDHHLIEETGSESKAAELLTKEFTDFLYTDKIIDSDIGEVKREEVITGRLIAQVVENAKREVLKDMSIFDGVIGYRGEENVNRKKELKNIYESSDQIGLNLDYLIKEFERIAPESAREVIISTPRRTEENQPFYV